MIHAAGAMTMNDEHDPEQDDRPTPVPSGDAPWEHLVAEWRASEQGCWTEPSNADD